jgi:uncharacterized protein YjiS (DUF1127 family)
MDTYETPYRSAAALFWLAAVMQAGTGRLAAAAKWLDARLERQRMAAASRRDFETMSERNLRDIGLMRVDVHPVTCGTLIELRNRI